MAAGLAVVLGACNSSKKSDVADAAPNPFFTEYTTSFGVPPFDKIEVAHYKPAFEKGMEEQKKEIDAIVNNPEEPTFENTIVALDRSGELLTKVMYAFSGQSSVNTTDEIQALEQELYPVLSAHSDDISLNPALFTRVKVVYDKQASMNLNKEQKKLLEETYKGFVRGGANLDADKQARLRELNEKISVLELTFGQNVLKETNAFKLVVDNKEDLAGLPESLIAAAAETAAADSMEGKWIFTLHNPSVMPFLQYAEIKKEGGNFEAEGWDWRYYADKARQAKFNMDENEVRPYLELNHVREGAFYVANKLYGITFTEIKDIPKPDPDAFAFECKDKNGSSLGVLYMDFYTRPGKGGGAWCGGYRDQSYKDGKKVLPVVTTVFNFSKPAAGQPALLSADEAETVFHEFGHALHGLFADVHYTGVAGVPRDFVELPSQVMEHWVFEPEVLKVYAKHYQTGEVIPQELVDKIVKSSKYGQGFATVEYLAASLLDMDYHTLKKQLSGMDIEAFEAEAMNKRGLIRQIPPRYRTTYFGHTMEGGYTAGYYSYIWAEVLDADAFEAYKETGDIFNPEVASKFRKNVLTPGGIDDAMDMYKNFRGKEPGIEPLLKNRGLK